MLSKSMRLDAKLIPLVARKGRRVGNDLLDIRVLEGREYSAPQFGIITSKKLSPKAVIRNRIRRRVRAALLELSQEGALRAGLHLIIPKSSSLVDLDFEKLKELLHA